MAAPANPLQRSDSGNPVVRVDTTKSTLSVDIAPDDQTTTDAALGALRNSSDSVRKSSVSPENRDMTLPILTGELTPPWEKYLLSNGWTEPEIRDIEVTLSLHDSGLVEIDSASFLKRTLLSQAVKKHSLDVFRKVPIPPDFQEELLQLIGAEDQEIPVIKEMLRLASIKHKDLSHLFSTQ